MKRSYVLILVLLGLSAIGIYIRFFRTQLSTVDEGPRNFGYKDTAAITKIFLADKQGYRSTLERTAGGWVVNGKFKCRTEAVLNLLEAVKHIEVKMPVPKESQPSVIRNLSSGAVKVEIYVNDDRVRQYYVGYEAEDYEGSYMLLSDPSSGENYDEPFVVWIPGFKGFLGPRYITHENDWRDRVVMSFTPPQIRTVEVKHFDMRPDSSFAVALQGTTRFSVTDGKGSAVAFAEPNVKQFIAYLQNVSYEGLITGKSIKLQDSLVSVGPFAEVTVTDVQGKKHRYEFFRKQFTGSFVPDSGVPFEFDPDRLYLRFDEGRQWALAQYFTMGKILVTSAYFSRVPVKK